MIEVDRISKRFGDVRAVDGVSLSIQRGEFLTLLGPSGCGKTTLLRLMSGFEIPDDGRVILDGQDVTHRAPYQRDVNQVFQSYALFPHMTVRENVEFGLRMRKLTSGEIEQRVRAAMEMVELVGLDRRKPSQLSGGQRQRVALARAIVCRPKVLLLDEPLAALDAKLRHAMQLELKALQQKLGMTFVFVTHDQSEAMVMSDRVAVMNEGRIEQLGAPAEVYRRPRSEFVARFLGQANLWEAEVISRDATGAMIRLDEQMILRVGPGIVPEGVQRVRILIRPERVRLSREKERVNSFRAEIIDEHFSGATSHFRLRTLSGRIVDVMAVHQDGGGLKVGERVYLMIGPDEIVALGSTGEMPASR